MGMTLLHAATLRSVAGCYDYDRYKMKFSVIDEKLHQIAKRYSNEFSSFLREILIEEENERPDFLSLA
jgi:hypothetical protein